MNFAKQLAQLLLASALFAGGSAHAALIDYIYSANASGTLGTTSFTNAAFAFTLHADTAGVVSCGDQCLRNDALATTVSIAGVGTYDVMTPSSASSYPSTYGNVIGLTLLDAFAFDVFDLIGVPAYDLTSAIGPLTASSSLFQWSARTTGGDLAFMGVFGLSATFEARLEGAAGVPEPASAALIGLGLAGLLAARRRTRARA